MPDAERQDPKRDDQTEFDPDDFLNDGGGWSVFTEGGGFVNIAKLEELSYRISYSNGQHDPQNLFYNKKTRTLDSLPDDPYVVRSVALWEGPDDRRTIFASFNYRTTVPAEDRWPIEAGGGKGTWGADDG